MSLFKVTHHIKKLLENIEIADASDASAATILEKLLQQHKEYQFEARDKLQTTVKTALTTLTEVKVQPSTPAVASLNQMMASQYNKSASKRQRPVEFDAPNNEDKPLDANNTISSSDKIEEADLKEQMKATEKAAPNTSGRKKKVTAATPRGDAGTGAINPLQLTSSGTNFLTTRPTTRLDDLAGIDSILQQIRELVFYPTQFPALYAHLGVSPPCGILLHGPSGCGKTMLANAIAGELGLPFFKASGPELVGGTSGESEERIRQIFESAAASGPSVLFIDAIDVIAGKKDSSQRGMERRIVAQLFDSIDYISSVGNASHASTNSHSDNSASDTKADAASIAETVISNINGDSAMEVEVNKEKDEGPAKPKLVVLIAATNKPEVIDPGVRGRFSREVALPVPDAPARSKILKLMTASMRLAPGVDFKALGKLTPGFVGADLQCLTREAGMLAVSRIVKQSHITETPASVGVPVSAAVVTNGDVVATELSHSAANGSTTVAAVCPAPVLDLTANACVEMTDFAQAVKSIQPTAKREGFAVAPDVTWSDVGALAEVREELLHNVLEPIAHPERFQHLGLEVPAGVLFFGPPGCGKTLLAKALANQSGANFISVKGPELLSMYVGESESKVRQVFARARASAPCVIFFDELDALCPKRGNGMEGSGGAGGNGVSDRVVNQLLTELDGLETRRDVYIIAATNRLELIDDAMLRPGRLGKLLYVPLPTPEDRISILQALTKKVSITWKSPIAPEGVDIQQIAVDHRADGFSGADLAALVREAGLAVVREIVNATKNRAVSQSGTTTITSEDIIGRAYTSSADLTALASNAADGSATAEGALPEELHRIQARHFEAAFGRVRASVSSKDRRRYEDVNTHIKDGMGAIQALQMAAKSMLKYKGDE